MERLDDGAIAAGLAGLGWERDGDVLVTTRTFGGFPAAMAWVNGVAALAEVHDHHPDITVTYDRVTLTLSTHSAGGITALDLDLAAAVDRLEHDGD